MTRGAGPHGFSHFWHVWNYIRLFWVTRRFLRAIKIATESWECVLSDQKFWSTGVDLLGNISIAFSLTRVQISLLATLRKVMVEIYKVCSEEFVILGSYIIGADTYIIVSTFSKVYSTFLVGNHKILKNLCFVLKKRSFFLIFMLPKYKFFKFL